MEQEMLLTLILFILFLAPLSSAQLTVSSVKAIEISPTQTVIITQTKQGCPQFMPPADDWCKDGVIVPGGVDENGCQLPPTCSRPVCEPPCVVSGETCTCPIEETKKCKVGCICEGEAMICPAEHTCEPPCIQSGDTCSCPLEPTETCPVDCVCEDGTTTCPTTETKPVEAKISSVVSLFKTVSIEKSQDKLLIKTEKATATTGEKLVAETDNLFLQTKTGNKEVKILPEEASQKAAEITQISEISLKEEMQEPTYFIKGTKQAKIFFIAPITIEIETKVNAGTGKVISVNKPWWSFLAW